MYCPGDRTFLYAHHCVTNNVSDFLSIKMPLYELLCLSPPQVIQAKVVARQSIKAIMDNGGVVKNIEYLGTKDLPYRMKKHQIIHEKAAYFYNLLHVSLLID